MALHKEIEFENDICHTWPPTADCTPRQAVRAMPKATTRLAPCSPQQAQHTLGHARADLDPGLMLGDVCIGQPVQAKGDALQLAQLVQTNLQLR